MAGRELAFPGLLLAMLIVVVYYVCQRSRPRRLRRANTPVIYGGYPGPVCRPLGRRVGACSAVLDWARQRACLAFLFVWLVTSAVLCCWMYTVLFEQKWQEIKVHRHSPLPETTSDSQDED